MKNYIIILASVIFIFISLKLNKSNFETYVDQSFNEYDYERNYRRTHTNVNNDYSPDSLGNIVYKTTKWPTNTDTGSTKSLTDKNFISSTNTGSTNTVSNIGSTNARSTNRVSNIGSIKDSTNINNLNVSNTVPKKSTNLLPYLLIIILIIIIGIFFYKQYMNI